MTPSQKYYEMNKEAVKQRSRITNAERKKRNQLFLARYLEGKKCLLCGFNNPMGLTFDHLRDKRMEVSMMAKASYSIAAIKAEIAKCRILCFNCHMVEENRKKGGIKWRYFTSSQKA